MTAGHATIGQAQMCLVRYINLLQEDAYQPVTLWLKSQQQWMLWTCTKVPDMTTAQIS
jgi:hypothetical protein